MIFNGNWKRNGKRKVYFDIKVIFEGEYLDFEKLKINIIIRNKYLNVYIY